MKKCFMYGEEEMTKITDDIYDKLYSVQESLAVITQQIEGGRTNVDKSYVRGVTSKLNEIVQKLDVLTGKHFKAFDLENAIQELEEKIEKAKGYD